MNANRPDNVPFLYFVVFAEDYTSFEIYDAKLSLVEAKTKLLESGGD